MLCGHNMAFAGRTKINTLLVFKIMKHTRSMKYSPGISTSTVAREKCAQESAFLFIKENLNLKIK